MRSATLLTIAPCFPMCRAGSCVGQYSSVTRAPSVLTSPVRQKYSRAMNSRRQILAAVGTCVRSSASLAGIAQGTRVYRIGWISLGKPDAPSPYLDAFRQGLKERGYIEGKNVVVEARLADGSRERADQMVAALVQSKVDVIVTQGAAAWSAYRHAGTTPVVMGYSGDPVEAKFVKSLAQPGGTITGMSFLALELVGKRLEVWPKYYLLGRALRSLPTRTIRGANRVPAFASRRPGRWNQGELLSSARSGGTGSSIQQDFE